jgi:hypothetical protein
LSVADWIKLVIAAASWPAASSPANNQFLRLVAQSRICCSS